MRLTARGNLALLLVVVAFFAFVAYNQLTRKAPPPYVPPPFPTELRGPPVRGGTDQQIEQAVATCEIVHPDFMDACRAHYNPSP